MDKKNHNLKDDEYHLQGDKVETPFSHTQPPTMAALNSFSGIQRQHVVLFIIVVFLVVGSYKLLNQVFHAIRSRPVVTKSLNQSKPGAVATSTSQLAVTSQMRVEQLSKEQLRLQSLVQSLNAQLSQVQSALTELTTEFDQLTEQVESLQSGQDRLFKYHTQAVSQALSAKKETPKVVYYVLAIIPGRVWLTTPEGATSTLAIGDHLPGYGNVTLINPEQGTITLSSGAVIGYRPNDK